MTAFASQAAMALATAEATGSDRNSHWPDGLRSRNHGLPEQSMIQSWLLYPSWKCSLILRAPSTTSSGGAIGRNERCAADRLRQSNGTSSALTAQAHKSSTTVTTRRCVLASTSS